MTSDCLKRNFKQMKKSHLKIKLHVPGELQEELISGLLDFGFSGFEQDEQVIEAWIPAERYTSKLGEQVDRWVNTQPNNCHILEKEYLEERNWNLEWEKSIHPQAIGSFYIHPTWSKAEPPAGAIPITIDPKMAFGTGYHETTRLLLKLLPDYVRPGIRVLDMGTGTGVLAIGALKLGAFRSTGIDIDPWSYQNAMENSVLNDMGDHLEIRIGSVEMIDKTEQFDLILANINRNVLLDLGDDLVKHMSPGGELLLSGIMKGDEGAIAAHPAYRALQSGTTISENEWIAMALKKNDG